ncbi:MAG: hypothetical protein KDA96_25265 [Planctomycetaceae bacterium]|nr:hypothetical protein [Planctomycetaceae bacterium]
MSHVPPTSLANPDGQTPPDDFSTPQSHAVHLLEWLGQIMSTVDDSQNACGPDKAECELALAYMMDAASLIDGISQGHIPTSQPRIVTRLLQAIEELKSHGHHSIAMDVTVLIRDVSRYGIGADGLVLDRQRSWVGATDPGRSQHR